MRLPKGLSVISIRGIKVAKLYDTNIVEIEGNRIILRTGGWNTKHTKKCINLVLSPMGLNLIQESFEWNLYRDDTLLGSFLNDTMEVSI